MDSETVEQMQARHRKELKELQGRITSKKKNATKKTRKSVNDECARMEADLKDQQAQELDALNGTTTTTTDPSTDLSTENPQEPPSQPQESQPNQPTESSSSSTHTPSSQPSQPGPKRNRQKERLARRAAEQQAATDRAHEEASTMTDHRSLENEAMKSLFKTHNLEEKHIAPDGHCLFSSIADQLQHHSVPLGGQHDDPPYKTIRTAAATHMLENRDYFTPFLDEDLDAYVAKVGQTAEWGGQLELMALARRYGVKICVVQDGRIENIGEEEGKETGKTLWLAYYRHGYGLGEHYNSLRKVK